MGGQPVCKLPPDHTLRQTQLPFLIVLIYQDFTSAIKSVDLNNFSCSGPIIFIRGGDMYNFEIRRDLGYRKDDLKQYIQVIVYLAIYPVLFRGYYHSFGIVAYCSNCNKNNICWIFLWVWIFYTQAWWDLWGRRPTPSAAWFLPCRRSTAAMVAAAGGPHGRPGIEFNNQLLPNTPVFVYLVKRR